MKSSTIQVSIVLTILCLFWGFVVFSILKNDSDTKYRQHNTKSKTKDEVLASTTSVETDQPESHLILFPASIPRPPQPVIIKPSTVQKKHEVIIPIEDVLEPELSQDDATIPSATSTPTFTNTAKPIESISIEISEEPMIQIQNPATSELEVCPSIEIFKGNKYNKVVQNEENSAASDLPYYTANSYFIENNSEEYFSAKEDDFVPSHLPYHTACSYSTRNDEHSSIDKGYLADCDSESEKSPVSNGTKLEEAPVLGETVAEEVNSNDVKTPTESNYSVIRFARRLLSWG